MKEVARPEGFIDTFERPALVKENERALETITQLQNVILQTQTVLAAQQQQLGMMRVDGKSSLEQQSAVIQRIQQTNRNIDDMGRQIGRLQQLREFNNRCIRYIDWLRGEV